MTEVVLFKATADDVRAIVERLNGSLISEIPEMYCKKYGAGWKLKLQGDIVAAAVEWCHRDYTATGYHPNADEIVKAYQKFMSDFCGTKMSVTDAKNDLAVHPRWTLDEALKLNSGSNSSDMAKWQVEAATFFTKMGRFSPAELEKFKKADLVTDKFLKIAAEKPLQ
jgi:hypothetical protein